MFSDKSHRIIDLAHLLYLSKYEKRNVPYPLLTSYIILKIMLLLPHTNTFETQ
jgi:hypothetical protein